MTFSIIQVYSTSKFGQTITSQVLAQKLSVQPLDILNMSF